MVIFVVLVDVVAPLHRTVHGNDVPQIEFDATSTDAVGDALHFITVFLIDVRPPDVFGGFAEKVPVFAGVVGEFEEKNFLQVGDFGCEEITMLVADLFGRAGQVDDSPIVDGRFAGRAGEESGVGGRERRCSA